MCIYYSFCFCCKVQNVMWHPQLSRIFSVNLNYIFNTIIFIIIYNKTFNSTSLSITDTQFFKTSSNNTNYFHLNMLYMMKLYLDCTFFNISIISFRICKYWMTNNTLSNFFYKHYQHVCVNNAKSNFIFLMVLSTLILVRQN